MMQMRKHLPLHLSLPTTSKKSQTSASKSDLPKDIQEYHQYIGDLNTIDGVILYKDCLVIPLSLREDILNILHSAQQSIGPMLSRTMSTVLWPGIIAAVQAHKNCCTDYHRNAPSPPSIPPYQLHPIHRLTTTL